MNKHSGFGGVVHEFKKNWPLWLMALPAIVLVFVLAYMPMSGLILAFKNYRYDMGIFGSPWCGMDNFEFLFMGGTGWQITKNTILYNILNLFTSQFLSIFVAIVITEMTGIVYKKIVQSVIFLPYFISWVIVSYMLQGILGTDTGLLNNLIVAGGGTRINFYSTPSYWYPILLILNIWKNTGYNTIVYLAAITGIDEGLYEAAYIDGATRFKRIIYITIPLLAPTICIMTLMSVGRIFYGDFGMLYAIIRDNSSLMPIAEVIDTYVYRTFKNTGDPSLSMAIGLYQSIVGFILVFTANWIVRKKFPEGALF